MLSHSSDSLRRHVFGAMSIALALALIPACSDDDSNNTADSGKSDATSGSDGAASDSSVVDATPATCATPGAPTPGAADTHCAGDDGGAPIVQPTNPANCHPTGVDGGPAPACPYGDTLFGQEADDDDCKYHVKWSSSAICEGGDGVKITLIVTNKSDGTPTTGANANAETFTTTPGDAGCDNQSTHPGPNSGVVFSEGPPGTYVAFVQFDKPGQWTMRFHFHEECSDLTDDSPHGHAAFHLTLP